MLVESVPEVRLLPCLLGAEFGDVRVLLSVVGYPADFLDAPGLMLGWGVGGGGGGGSGAWFCDQKNSVVNRVLVDVFRSRLLSLSVVVGVYGVGSTEGIM